MTYFRSSSPIDKSFPVLNQDTTPKTSETYHDHSIKNLTSTRLKLGRILEISFIFSLIIGLTLMPFLAVALPYLCQGNQCQKAPLPLNNHGNLALNPTFPPYLPRFMDNGLQLVARGSAACSITSPLEPLEECEIQVFTAVKSLINSGQFDDIFNPESFGEKGTAVEFIENGKKRHVALGQNPQRLSNYERSLKYIEKFILQNPVFFQKETEEILKTVKYVHYLLMHELLEEMNLAGEYRTRWVVVKNLEKIKEIGTSSEAKIFEEFLELSSGQKMREFSKKEWDVLKKLLYIPPPPEEIEREMFEFIDELKYRLSEMPTLEVASWAHFEMVRIHPFIDGNGRLARILLNTLLVRGGFEPVIFSDDDAYDRAIQEEHRNPGSFLSYLNAEVFPWIEDQRELK